MISSAIQSSLVMIPIILIVHLLLKHILIDKINDQSGIVFDKEGTGNKQNTQNKSSVDSEDYDNSNGKIKKKSTDSEQDRRHGNLNNKIEKTFRKSYPKEEVIDEDDDDEETFLRNRLTKICSKKNEGKTVREEMQVFPSPKVKFQHRRPAVDPRTTNITPNPDDVFSFVLEGDPPRGGKTDQSSLSGYNKNNDDFVQVKKNSFFTDPHIPQDDMENEGFVNEGWGSKEDDKIRRSQDENNRGESGFDKMHQKMYVEPMLRQNKSIETPDLFNNISAANSDNDESSLDEIFRQTQVPNT